MRTSKSRAMICSTCVLLAPDIAAAQNWVWGDNGYPERPGGDRYGYSAPWPGVPEPRYWSPTPPPRFDRPPDRGAAVDPAPGGVRDGGERPYIEAVVPPIVAFRADYAPNTIIIDTGGRRLYYVL